MELSQKAELKINPNWNLLFEDDQLVIAAGADELYMVDGIPVEVGKKIYEAYQTDSLSVLDRTNAQLEDTLQKLVTAGVLYKSAQPQAGQLQYSIRWVGSPNEKIGSYIRQFAETGNGYSESEKPDVAVIIRTNGELKSILEDYEKFASPHLFADVGYKNHVSFGPFVIPGETACMGCFLGRIMRNWGDPPPPRIPLASEHTELIASLIFEYLSTFKQLSSCPALLERAMTFNLTTMETQSDPVFRLPWCPVCKQDAQSITGSYELPWIKK